MDLQQTLEAVMAVVSEPTSNLTAFALIAAAVVLAALILILTAIMWLVAPLASNDEEGEEAEEQEDPSVAPSVDATDDMATPSPATPESPWSRWGWTGLMVLLFLTAFGSAYAATSTDQFCLDTCHSDLVEAVAQVSAHDETRCTSCHEDPLPQALFTNTLGRIAHVMPRGESPGSGVRATVAPARCERCHEGLREGTQTFEEIAIRMSHLEPLEAGMSCEDCHEISVHGRPATPVAMAACLPCHDEETASSECSVCHTSDPADSVRSSERLVLRDVKLPRVDDCGGCHDQTACDECHGLRMPHDREFIEGDHAMQAAFDRKPLCWRCHAEDDCGDCHGTWQAHGDTFKRLHQAYPRGSECSRCHPGHEGSFCARCHGPGW